MKQVAGINAELVQDRLELLRLRTVLVGILAIVGLIFGLVALLGFGSQALQLVGQALVAGTETIHVPENLFQAPAAYSSVLYATIFQLQFFIIGIGGIVKISRQAMNPWQTRLWVATLVSLGAIITYQQSNLGSVWHENQRELVKAVRAKQWTRVEQLSSASENPTAHAYVMAQVGLGKQDSMLVLLHGKPLIDSIDDLLLLRGNANDNYNLKKTADAFRPEVLKNIDLAVYGAPHTQIGLTLSSAEHARPPSSPVSALGSALLATGAACACLLFAIALLRLWWTMRNRLLDLRNWANDHMDLPWQM